MSTVKSFQDLEIWQLAIELDKRIHRLTENEIVAKDFAYKNQISRSAGSIADNIAEGFGRGGRLEFIQFLSIARASASEVQSQLIRGSNKNYLAQDLLNDLMELSQKIGNKIGAFIKYLNQSDVKGPKFQNRINGVQDFTNGSNERQETRNESNEKQETRNVFKTNNAASPLGQYPHARQAGNLLFLSGIGSRSAEDNSIPGLVLDEEGNKIDYDIEAECHSVFKNVKAVLEASGSSWDKIIDVTVFLTNMKKDFPLYNKIYGEYFEGVQACRTTVEVLSLPTPIAIELKVIALM